MPLNYTAPPEKKAWWDNEYFQSLRELLGFAAAAIPEDNSEEDDDAFAVDDPVTYAHDHDVWLPQKKDSQI